MRFDASETPTTSASCRNGQFTNVREFNIGLKGTAGPVRAE
jgi:hypothetical protein